MHSGKFVTNGLINYSNNVPNSTSSILDLAFSNYFKLLTVDNSNEPLVHIDQYHPTLNITLPDFSSIYHCIS